MRKLVLVFIAVLFLFTACQKSETNVQPVASTEFQKDVPVDPCVTTKLIAGGGQYDESCEGLWVGNVYVEDDGVNITVTYEITEPGWVMDVTHLYIGAEDGIPTNNKGNPKLGHFDYGSELDEVTEWSHTITRPTGDYIVAAHADVRLPAMTQFCMDLPEIATVVITHPGLYSYFTAHLTNAEPYNGEYPGWCIDVGHNISPGVSYSMELYCGYNGLPDGITVDYPDSIPVVNWLINQNLVGAPNGNGGVFTKQDIQTFIWKLIDETPTVWNPFTQANILLLHDLVIANQAEADAFVPTKGQLIAVILDPIASKQVTIALIIFEFEDIGETAWGYGYDGSYCDPNGANGISFTDAPDYGGSAWGWYFYGCN